MFKTSPFFICLYTLHLKKIKFANQEWKQMDKKWIENIFPLHSTDFR